MRGIQLMHLTHRFTDHDLATHHHKNRQHLRRKPQDRKHLTVQETLTATSGLRRGIKMMPSSEKLKSSIFKYISRQVSGAPAAHVTARIRTNKFAIQTL